jgi:ketosteroid isomerase-like protein
MDTLTLVRSYHDAWTAKDFERAAALLADDLEVEVPINEYPTRDSFAAAVEGFGSLARGVTLRSAMSAGDEAMLLYDMDVAGLGDFRVAEHFTVRDGRIARIRQIHDTAAVRGLVADIRYRAKPEQVFDALSHPERWWSTSVDADGDRLRMNWRDGGFVTFRASADPPHRLIWQCVEQVDHYLPRSDEWVGTAVIFELAEVGDGARLHFEHRGLTPALDCYDVCENGWDFYLRRSIGQLLETGRGIPSEV